MGSYLAVTGAAALIVVVFTPVVRALVARLGGYDVPVDRKVHRAPTPTYGGIAIYVGVAGAFGLATALGPLEGTFRFSEVFGLLLGGLIALALGVLDDRHDLPPAAKAAGQIFAGGVLYLSGVQMAFFWLPGVGVISLSPDVSAILTIFWIVLLMNAVNFVDGLDGLAAGLCFISSAGLFIYSTRLPEEFLGPDPLAPLVAAAVAGACLGFLPHNFNPAKIFMGDTGAMPLGFFLAGATISMIGRFTGPGSAGGRLALPLIFTPIVFLALPLTDVGYGIVRRLIAGRSPFRADAEHHLHYRLLALGHSHRRAVLVLYGWGAFLTLGLVVAGTISWGRFVLAFAVAGGMVLLATLEPRWRRSETASEGQR